MGPPGGSKQSIYARFLRHFNLFAINQFRNESLTSIFSIILYIGLKKNGYGTEIVTTITPLVSACLRVFNEAVSHLLPTPAKSHYIFNLRDTFRVISGILLVTKEAVDSKRSFIRLWAHEIFRVFYDRLIDDSDRKWLFGTIQVIVLEEFSENFDKIFDQLELDNRPITEDGLRNLVFSAALDQDTDENKKYEEVPVRAFEKFCVDMLIDYNLTHKTKLNIILFRFALEHLSRLCRILTTPGGSGLLVGVSGSGRQSLTALAAYIYNQPIFQPQITKSYGFMDWRNDLKVLLKECGGRKKQGVFLFTETQVKADYNLQDIDALLNSAEVPNIFTMDELEEVFEMVRSAIQLKDPDINQVALYNLFKSRCRLNIHMVLCFSPIGSLFRNRVRLYPSLVNCCTIDWYEVITDFIIILIILP
ncbi:hypothetical protein O3M35_003707 [Rhynocoris fuscipes]|uniref:Dynein heavy chain n=1 Tax=Rhynocoris fuscipes TaxID=488301 RepID=A0AAW1CJD0_9HEMI